MIEPGKRFIYVGPSIDAVAIRNTIYSEAPHTLSRAIEARPYLGGLCIPVSALGEALKQIQFRRGTYYTLYARASREAREIQKEGRNSYGL